MTAEKLEERVLELEERMRSVEGQIRGDAKSAVDSVPKRGWRAFVGVDADNPDFAEAVRLGREWRFADSPDDEKNS